MKLFANLRIFSRPKAKNIQNEFRRGSNIWMILKLLGETFIITYYMTVESVSEKGIDNIFDNKDISKSLDKLKLNISNGTQLNLFKGMVDIQNNSKVKEKASGLMSMIGGILNIDVPMMGKVGELFETKRPADILGERKNNKNKKFLNSILKVFGIKDGIPGLHKNYIEEQLKQRDTTFAKEAFNYFSTNSKAETQEENTLRKKYNLDETIKPLNLKDEEITKIKTKIPSDYLGIKGALIATLPKNINNLNSNALAMMGDEYIKIVDNKPVINSEKITKNPEEFADKYLSFIISKLITSGDEFINSEYVNQDTFALAIFGNLVGEKFFIEGINIGSILVQDYKNIQTTNQNPKENLTSNPEQIKKNIQSELDKVKNCPLTADMILKTSNKYKVPVEYIMAIMKNDSNYGTAGIGAKTHNPGNVGNTDNGSTKDWKTRDNGVDAVGENLARRIKEYQTTYTTTKLPSIKELANNQGPDNKGFLSNQAHYKQDNPDRKGAYMTATHGGINVQNISNQLVENHISNQYELAA